MVYSLFIAIAVGVCGGYYFLGLADKDSLDNILMNALYFMVLVGGIEIGSNKELLYKILQPRNLIFAFAIPILVVLGSFAGGLVSILFTGLSINDSLLVTAGLGWYSLSSVVVSTMHSNELGTITFLSNMLRETSAFILIPFLSRFNKILSIAPGGAGTMDSLLPIMMKSTDMHTSMLSFLNGLVLSLIVPIILSLMLE